MSPRQAALLWLAEAHEHASLLAYEAALKGLVSPRIAFLTVSYARPATRPTQAVKSRDAVAAPHGPASSSKPSTRPVEFGYGSGFPVLTMGTRRSGRKPSAWATLDCRPRKRFTITQ